MSGHRVRAVIAEIAGAQCGDLEVVAHAAHRCSDREHGSARHLGFQDRPLDSTLTLELRRSTPTMA
ncbi:MAG: hypothetical protein WBD02_10280 [Acidimicrobiia bacterium]